MPPEVDLLGVLLATVSSFVIGGIWYGPLFGQAWMTANGFTVEDLKANWNPAKTYGITFVIGLVTCYTFAMFLGEGLGWADGAQRGLIAGLVWVAGSIATNYQFESTGNNLLMINGGYHAVRFAVIGAILGAMN
jgi:hypothetical protein